MARATCTSKTALFAVIAGAAAMGLVTLFTSSKGAQARKDLAALGRHLKTKARLLAGRGTRAWEAFKEDPEDLHPASGQDQRGKAAGVWQDAKDRAGALGMEARLPPADPANGLGRA